MSPTTPAPDGPHLTDTFSPGGEKLLATASRLFYAEGIHAVGVDRVTAESGVSKPTLYAQFGTKDGLVAAVLRRRYAIRRRSITDQILRPSGDRNARERHDDRGRKGGRILALFDRFLRNHTRPGFRGCPFTLAAAELPDPRHPARVVIADYKSWLHGALVQMCLDDGIAASPAEAEDYAGLFSLLIDGAHAQMITSGDRHAMERARGVAVGVIAAAGR